APPATAGAPAAVLDPVALYSELERLLAVEAEVAVLVLEVDGLERLAAAQGPAGERVRVAVERALRDGIRGIDVVGRIGDDAFGVLLPRQDTASAAVLAERLRRSVADAGAPDGLPLSVAVGVSSSPD